MYCSKCGQEVKEGTQFCVHCGQRVGGSEPQYQYTQQPQGVSNGKAMGFGIASLACGVFGLCYLVLPFMALPLGIVAVKLSNTALNTRWHNMARAGRITGKLSIIFGAIFMFFYFIYFIAILSM